MPYPISLDQLAKQTMSFKQTQRLIMSPQMQQAIHLLQMPVLELTAALEEELQQNPIIDLIEHEDNENSQLKNLEEENREEKQILDQAPEKELTFSEHDFEILKKLDEEFHEHFSDSSRNYSKTQDEDKLKNFQDSLICAEPSLYEHLINQSKEVFEDEESLKAAEALIGNFDENGFLKTPLEEIATLNNLPIKKLKSILIQIQTFEPFGVGAKNLQESLLIQLTCLQKNNSLAYKIIQNNFEDLLHNRIPTIKKDLDCSSEEIEVALKKDISRLDLHPGIGHYKHFVQYITPDASIDLDENDELKIRINDDFLPSIKINSRYLRMLSDETTPEETKEFIRNKFNSAKWLFKNIHQRNDTLQRILELLIKFQKAFFMHPEGKLVPLTMKIISEELELHESTIARAVSNKYVDTPRGLLPLRSFFTNALSTQEGEDVSSDTVKKALNDLIVKEDKTKPLSDADLSKKLEDLGFNCARRTVAKYRTELNLGNAHQRKKY
jgi:RNA polymerase sigma-54 factor